MVESTMITSDAVKTTMKSMVCERWRKATLRPLLRLAAYPSMDEEKYLDFVRWVSLFH